MTNIVENKNHVRGLINQSSLAKLIGMQERLLHSIDNLPDEIAEEDVGLLDAIETIVGLSENDADMQETIQAFLKLQEVWKGLIAIEEQTLKDQTAIIQEGIRRFDEIKARRDQNPEAPIDDLLAPIVINPTPVP